MYLVVHFLCVCILSFDLWSLRTDGIWDGVWDGGRDGTGWLIKLYLVCLYLAIIWFVGSFIWYSFTCVLPTFLPSAVNHCKGEVGHCWNAIGIGGA
jgi:hypothetical protein